jgi:hypothetical protein
MTNFWRKETTLSPSRSQAGAKAGTAVCIQFAGWIRPQIRRSDISIEAMVAKVEPLL